MRCPSLSELPPPPQGRAGWPWTSESARFEGLNAPRFTIVTPSFMQADFLEMTIRSVLLQGYPNVEYFVLDGGSTDGSREIITKYERWIAGWRSERDAGQSAAVNEGWRKASGEWCAWINSDDWYQPGAFNTIALAAAQGSADWLAGHVDDYTIDGTFLKRHPARAMELDELLGRKDYGFHQPGMFWRLTLLRAVGMLDESLYMCFCPDLWSKTLAAGYRLQVVDAPIACFRRHGGSKTGGNAARMLEEDRVVWRRYAKRLPRDRRARADRWLRDFEADRLITSTYQLLHRQKHGQALLQLVKHARLLPHMSPPRLYAGALLRTLLLRPPPKWFTEKSR